MPQRGSRTVVKICPCGCGNQIPPRIDKKTGRVSIYPKFISGHGMRAKADRQRGVSVRIPRPIGASRLHYSGPGMVYRMIKTKTGWKYEHRAVMETMIGRPLETWEHVHHVNEDTLNNSPENLRLTTRYAHPGIHVGLIGWARKHDRCTDCGGTSRQHVALGLCTACYQRSRYPNQRAPGGRPGPRRASRSSVWLTSGP